MASEVFLDAAAVEGVRTSLDAVNRSFGELERVMQKPLDDLTRKAEQGSESLEALNKEMSDFKKGIEGDLGQAFKNIIRNGDGFLGFFEKVRGSLEDLVLQLAVVNPAMKALFGEKRGTVSDLADGIVSFGQSKQNGLAGDLFGGILDLFDARAFGGPVNARQPYLVGERGPELFVPQAAGRIQANAGGSPVSIHMNITTNDAASFRASQTQIAAAMMDAARRAQRIR